MLIKRPHIRWAKLVFALLVVLAAMELCVDLSLFDGGSPITESGSVSIDEIPEVDSEYVATSIAFLREIGWWQSKPYLVGISREIDCSQIQDPPHQRRLTFRRVDRISLLGLEARLATVEFTEDGTELRFRLDNFEGELIGTFKRSEEELDLVEVEFESDEALLLVEQNGGKVLRGQVGDRCYVYMAPSLRNGWEITYTQKDTFEYLLCFEVDPDTNEVKQVKKRSYRSCRYFNP